MRILFGWHNNDAQYGHIGISKDGNAAVASGNSCDDAKNFCSSAGERMILRTMSKITSVGMNDATFHTSS